MSEKKKKTARSCWKCGTEITDKNGYFLKKGNPLGLCKKCHPIVMHENYWKRKGTQEILDKINNLYQLMDLLIGILEERKG